MATLLNIINSAQAELGLAQSATIVGNTDATTVQMYNIMQGALQDVRHETIWSFLQTEADLVVTTPITTYTGTTTSGSVTLTAMSSIASITAPYFIVTGTGIPTNTRVTATSGTTVTMSQQATSSNTAEALTFAQDTYALPSDFDYLQSRTWWDRTNRWELLGPDSPQLDQWHRSGIVTTGPRRHFRIIGANVNTFRLWPPPTEISANLQLAYEYISTNTVKVSGSTTSFASTWANDADVPFFDTRLMVLYLKYKFWQIKGFNYLPLQKEYEIYLDRLIAQDGGNNTLNLTKRINPIFVSPANVQDGFYPGPVGPNMG